MKIFAQKKEKRDVFTKIYCVHILSAENTDFNPFSTLMRQHSIIFSYNENPCSLRHTIRESTRISLLDAHDEMAIDPSCRLNATMAGAVVLIS